MDCVYIIIAALVFMILMILLLLFVKRTQNKLYGAGIGCNKFRENLLPRFDMNITENGWDENSYVEIDEIMSKLLKKSRLKDIPKRLSTRHNNTHKNNTYDVVNLISICDFYIQTNKTKISIITKNIPDYFEISDEDDIIFPPHTLFWIKYGISSNCNMKIKNNYALSTTFPEYNSHKKPLINRLF